MNSDQIFSIKGMDLDKIIHDEGENNLNLQEIQLHCKILGFFSKSALVYCWKRVYKIIGSIVLNDYHKFG